jgi:hypothetical protein
MRWKIMLLRRLPLIDEQQGVVLRESVIANLRA